MIHHTAIAVPETAGAEAIREIWQLHARDRGWGDIGYHFLIDPSGRIYEGRAGGFASIGGHFIGGNPGTIGIALLGDFTVNAVPERAIQALIELVAYLSRTLALDPMTNSFHEKAQLELPTICGHRDGKPSTVCPGDFLYYRLPEVKREVLRLISA